ncbi:MAG: single-stranded-DNA-specific exonuclease RecJ [Lachnospiraceae bacterium]|nr:single-stranded-DNA-specific exonuclease RecJ [Lachnospiraceae bacterium]
MKQKWVIINKKGDVKAVAKEQGVSEIIARVLINRDLDTKDKRDVYLHPSVCGLRDGSLLKNAGKAAEILKEAAENRKKIRIVGDYDVDGITSTYILYKTLKERGAKVSYRIPDRIADGYGINRNIVDEAIADGIQLILTCDNGISEYDTISYAKEKGITVVLTDHHEVPVKDGKQILPPADVVVNPKQEGETTPYTGLCGCVVAMKVLECMGADLRPLLPYAAMATLCDVMDLRDENRVIVILGLEELRRTRDTGLIALIHANGLNAFQLSVYHIGFVIGPCLNASGRLDTAEKALELLLETDAGSAAAAAEELVELNNERKAMTEAGTDRAGMIIETVAKKQAEMAGTDDWEKFIDKVIVVNLAGCHESVVGIIAGRIREKYARPTFILTEAESGDCLKGSGRSTENFSMYEEMSKIGDVFTRFGGHPMAAGLSMEREKLAEFQRRINENCSLTEEDLVKKVRIDTKLSFEAVTTDLVDELERLEPFGKGNEKPVFAEKDVRVERAMILGQKKNVLKMNLVNSTGFRMSGVYFGDIAGFTEKIAGAFGREEVDRMFKGMPNNVKFSATYVPDRNEYNGIVTLQAKIQEILV